MFLWCVYICICIYLNALWYNDTLVLFTLVSRLKYGLSFCKVLSFCIDVVFMLSIILFLIVYSFCPVYFHMYDTYPNFLNIHIYFSQRHRESNGFVLLSVLRHTIMKSPTYALTQCSVSNSHWQRCPWRRLKSSSCVRRNLKHNHFIFSRQGY